MSRTNAFNSPNCEVLFRIKKESLDIAGGADVNIDDLNTGVDDQSIMFGYAANETEDARHLTGWRAAAARDRSIQQHNNDSQQLAKQTKQGREKEKKGERGKREEQEEEKTETGEETKKEKGKEVQEETDKGVEKDPMDWTLVTRSKMQRRKTVQIFVKVDGSRAILMDVSQNDKVSGGRVLRKSDALRSCGVRDGSTVQVMNRLRGGGKHKDKKSKEEKKQVAQLDDGMCSMACEQMRWITESVNKLQSRKKISDVLRRKRRWPAWRSKRRLVICIEWQRWKKV